MKGSQIKIQGVSIARVKADLVKGTIDLTLSLSLNAENIALRDDLSFAAFNETPFDIVLTERQGKMDALLEQVKRK